MVISWGVYGKLKPIVVNWSEQWETWACSFKLACAVVNSERNIRKLGAPW